MTISSVLVAKAFILSASVMSSGLGLAQDDSMDSGNIGCGLRIFVPNYPTIARAARITGTATVSITLGDDGHPVRIGITGVHPLLRSAVEKKLRVSEFSPGCGGKKMRLIFDFVIMGEPAANPQSSFAFMPPNKFVVSTQPGIPMP